MRTRRGLGAVVQSYNFIGHSINSTGASAGQNTTCPRGQTSLPSWKTGGNPAYILRQPLRSAQAASIISASHARSSTPDLFSSAPAREAHSRASEPLQASPAMIHTPRSEVPSRHVLPADLPNAVRHLKDQELDQLLSAVIAEQKRRGKNPSAEISRKQRIEMVPAVPLTQGKVTAIRAA